MVPDWQNIGDEVAAILTSYASEGGKVLLFGAANAKLFSAALGLRVKSPAQEHLYYVAGENGFAQVAGSWIDIDAPAGQVSAYAYPSPDARPNADKAALPLAVRVRLAKGSVIVCPGPIASVYGHDSTPILRSLVLNLLDSLHPRTVTLEPENPAIEVVLRKKNGQTLIHLINAEGAPATGEFRHSGVVPPTGPIRLRIRLGERPVNVFLEPDGTRLAGEYQSAGPTGGEWSGELPDLHVHSIIRIEGKTLIATSGGE